jgi:outer membrane receptor protein involved in Fe transport
MVLPFTASVLMPATARAQQVASVHVYAIGAGDLHKALNALSAQGGVQVVYSPSLVAGKTTRGLSGNFAPTDALRRLLAGTGLTWQSVNASTFLLKTAPPAAGRTSSTKEARKADADKSIRTLDTVNVSGSLINNAQIQTATPTMTITAQDIQEQGFTDVADVLQNSVLAVGSVQGPSDSGAYTQGAQTFSMFGLSPSYTLMLVDGKPVSAFGELYNGSKSFNNLGNIPLSMIDHIDVMPGGGSAIYGSSAIAGVVNIVTKQHVDGGQISVRTGNFSDGGGANQRLSASWGHDFGKLSVLAALEFDNASPIWNYQRSMTAGVSADPNGKYTPTPVAEIEEYGTSSKPKSSVQGYLSPTDGCAALAGLFGGTTIETRDLNSTKRTGTYCGSDSAEGYKTLANQKRSYSGMTKLKYDVNDDLRLYTDLMMNYQASKWNSSLPNWSTNDWPGGMIEDKNTKELLDPELQFGPEEMAGGYYMSRMQRQTNLMYQADVGANGHFGDSGWDWDFYVLHASDDTHYDKPEFLADKIDTFFTQYFLGPKKGTGATGLYEYDPDYAAFYTPLTPAQISSFSFMDSGYAKAWVNNTRATVSNSSLFSLPGGDAGFAVIVEGGNEAWYEPANPIDVAGNDYGHTATSGGGRRNHYASAAELNLPLFNELTLDLSGRYDHYSTDVGPANHKFTYKGGIEYRPFNTLLLRANYTTSFQAPQMPAMFLGPSGSYDEVTDYYQCALNKVADCDDYEDDAKVTHIGNTGLKPTTAQSWTVGGVWSPSGKVSFNVDYMHIAIQNEVVLQDVDQLLTQESQCRLGILDESSVSCQEVLSQVQRDPATGQITGVTAYYANLSNETTDSITATGKYVFDPTRFGQFGIVLNYNDMLKHVYQEYPHTPVIDQLANPYYSAGFKSIVTGSLTWRSPGEHWSTTVYGRRAGKAPNYIAYEDGASYAGAGYVHPWITFNWTLRYAPTPKLGLSLLVNNIANKMPPADPTWTSYPYYNYKYYNVLGRQVMLQADYKF